jgi:maltooligosyltrehalose trehalohydrolase
VHQIAAPGVYRAMTALTMLMPGTPMLFMGQEFAASAPFLFFADHKPELRDLVCRGRTEFLLQWKSYDSAEIRAGFADPCALETFERSKLDLSERETHGPEYALHRDLIRLRRADSVLSGAADFCLDGAVLGPQALALRYFAGEETRLLLVNFGVDLRLDPAPEPLLAPPENRLWRVAWSSEEVRYGGLGIPEVDTGENWLIPGHAALWLEPGAQDDRSEKPPPVRREGKGT